MRILRHASTLFFLLGLFAFRSSLADQYVIPSGSMEPTIQIGDHVWVDKLAYDLRVPFTSIRLARMGEPRRGEVIVFRDPREPGRRLIKRLIGLPGDRVRVVDGLVRINGESLPTTLGVDEEEVEATLKEKLASERKPFVYEEQAEERWHEVQREPRFARSEDQEFTVPADQYFFLGDNRDNSADSRAWGFASRDALEGRAGNVIYSVTWRGWIPRVSLARAGREL